MVCKNSLQMAFLQLWHINPLFFAKHYTLQELRHRMVYYGDGEAVFQEETCR